MGRYRMVGRAYGVDHAGLVAGRNVGDEFDEDFSEDQERALVGAGAVEKLDGEAPAAVEVDPMDAPPHSAEPGVGFQEVGDTLVGEDS